VTLVSRHEVALSLFALCAPSGAVL